MGFPEWTLWGMGLAAAGALIAITLSWLGQSPQMARRLGLSGARLDLRVRAFTGYGLALLLLAIAFFLAGVPIGTPSESETLTQQDVAPVTDTDSTGNTIGSEMLTSEAEATPATPETGAFSGPPPSDSSTGSQAASPAAGATAPITRGAPPVENTESSPTAEALSGQPSPSATSRPTETPTPAPTETSFPTLTPTTIAGETAVVSTNGSTLWLKRSPGGQNLVLVRDEDLVLLRASRANQGGILWREVATLSGVIGWLQDEFLIVAGQEPGG